MDDFKYLTVYDHGECRVYIEYNDTHLAVHLGSLENFTKHTWKWFDRYQREMEQFLHTVGYESIHVVVHKTKAVTKLVEKLGYNHVGDYQNHNIYRKDI